MASRRGYTLRAKTRTRTRTSRRIIFLPDKIQGEACESLLFLLNEEDNSSDGDEEADVDYSAFISGVREEMGRTASLSALLRLGLDLERRQAHN